MKSKGIRQVWAFAVVLWMLTMIYSGTALAASLPDKVKGLKAEAGNKKVVLTWKETEKADGYLIYLMDPAAGNGKTFVQAARVRKGSRTTYTLKGLVNFRTYQLKVAAYRKKNGKLLVGKASRVVKVKPTLPKPKAPVVETDIRSGKVTFSWKKVKHATGYRIYKKVGTKYRLVADVTDTSAVVRGLTNRKSYTFRIRAYRTSKGHTVKGHYTQLTLTVLSREQQAAALTTEVTYEGHLNQTMKFSKLDQRGKITVAAGTTVGYYYDGVGGVVILLADGTRVRGSSALITPHGKLYVHHEPYTKTAVEYYVNQVKHVTSDTNWMLWINFYTQYCYIFNREKKSASWECYGIWPCATGIMDHQTPRGNQKIVMKTERFYFKNGYGAYGMWASFIDGSPANGNAIHSPRRHYDGRLMEPYGTIGFPMSSGCVRLLDDKAKFVYDNCPIGTRLYIY